jgi:hypothetical protein
MQKFIWSHIPLEVAESTVNVVHRHMLKYAWTVRSPQSFMLKDYIGRWESRLTISPKNTPGITINWIEISPENTHGITQLIARFNVAKEDKETNEGKIFKVIEHLISALYAAWITQADVSTGTKFNFIPVIWPWIEPIYSGLKWNIKYFEDQPLPIFYCRKKIEIKSRLDKSPWKIIIEPSKSWKFEIEVSASYRDINWMKSEPIKIDDVYADIDLHKTARPIARIQHQTLRNIHWALDKIIGFPWINDTTYIMPDNTPEWNYVGQMHSQYQEGANEHFAHTVYADFFGELHTFFTGRMWAVKITVVWWGHPWRIDMLKQLAVHPNFRTIQQELILQAAE